MLLLKLVLGNGGGGRGGGAVAATVDRGRGAVFPTLPDLYWRRWRGGGVCDVTNTSL